jgi:hypothetical protein
MHMKTVMQKEFRCHSVCVDCDPVEAIIIAIVGFATKYLFTYVDKW